MSGSNDRWARVKDVFNGALARGVDERPAYVASACGQDDGLRAEVERLLAAHVAAGGFLEIAPPSMTGQRIGRYEIGARLGAGGMGEVYTARDVELGREVAVKVGLSPGDDSRLLREAQHAARLNHPHICTVHEVGTFDGRVCIVMERVDGRPLAELIPPEGLAPDEAVRYGIQVADALAHAHRHGVTHRDLKSANIVVTADRRAKVLDFGLSRGLAAGQLEDASTSRAPITADGALAGTLSSMAPELLRGHDGDARADIWALGVLLYEMTTGRRPFAGATPFELCASILHEAPAPVPARVPAALRHAIARCLEKDPRDRFAQSEDACSALEAVPLGAAASSSWRRRVAAAAVVLVLLVAGDIAWRMGSRTQPGPGPGAAGRPAIAVLAFENLARGEETSWLSTGVQSMLATGLAQTPALEVIASERLQEVIRNTGSASELARRAGARVAVVGTIAQAGAAFRLDARVEDLTNGRIVTATSVTGTDLFALVDQLTTRIRDGLGVRGTEDVRPVAQVSSASLDAYRLYSQGVDAYLSFQLDLAQRHLEEAVGIDPAFADAYLELALLSGPAGRPAERRGYLRKAAEHAGRLPERRRLLMNVEMARDEARFSDAARTLEELLAKYPDLEAVSTLGMQLHSPVVGPMPDDERLLGIQRRVAAAHPTSAYVRNNLAYAHLYAGHYDEAIRELESAVRLAPRQAYPLDGLGEASLLSGSAAKAIEIYSRALAVDPGFSFSRRGRAWALGVLGRFDEALEEDHDAPYLTAVVLARAGRYGEADVTLAGAVRTARASGDMTRLAGLHLLSAMLAVERRQYGPAIDACRLAEQTLANVPDARRRFSLGLLELICGVAELTGGRPAEARARFERQRRIDPAGLSGAAWWHHALEGEIALAEGDLDRAAAAFARAEPPRKQFFSGLVEGSVLSNDLMLRDGVARLAKARGDLPAAIDAYRRLLTFGPDQRWVAVFEPRYVLEIARLRAQRGDGAGARAEYRRFLDLWNRADAGLPEVVEARRALAAGASR